MGSLFKGPKTNTTRNDPNADAAFNMARPILDYASNCGSSLKKRLIKSKLTNISKGKIKVDYRMRFPDIKKKR